MLAAAAAAEARSFPARPDAVPEMDRWIELVGERWGVDRRTLFRARVCVSELANNILARLRLRPTRHVYCLSHSGGLGSLGNAYQWRSNASLACRACSRLPTWDIATPRQQPSHQSIAEHSSLA